MKTATQIVRIAGIAVVALVLAATTAMAQPVMEVTGGNVIIEQTSSRLGVGTSNPVTPFHLSAPGQTQFLFESTSAGNPRYNFKIDGLGRLVISKLGTSGAEMIIRESDDMGGGTTMTVNGSVTADAHIVASSRALKENFVDADASAMLAKVVDMPIQQWEYIDDPNDTPRIGPMAEDFYAAFGVGSSDKHLSVTDVTGVALAAIQGLHAEVESRDERIAELEQRLLALEQHLASK